MRPSPPPKPAKPREHQREAIRDVVKGFTKSDRGQLIMACGTGKTLTSLFIKEKLDAERTLVLVPSLSLAEADDAGLAGQREGAVRGAARLLRRDGGRSERGRGGRPYQRAGCAGHHRSADIAAFLRRRSGPRVVFSTYQSSPQIAAAFALGRVPAFDLVIADEAHRVAGVESSDFATVLDAAAIKAQAAAVHDGDPAILHGPGPEGGAGSRP